MKTCRKCKQHKEVSSFGKRGGKPHLYRSECRSCESQRTRINYAKQPKFIQEKNHLSRIKLLYGLSNVEYYQLVQKQDNKCAICLSTHKNRLNVDHDHMSGHVRGLLCPSCNRGLGYFKDRLDLLELAIDYLSGDSR